jgi:uncharacterized protein
MTIDEIIAALKTDNDTAALTAGLPRADELSTEVYSIADKFCRGIHLLPGDNELLFNGLHILAAARHPDLCSLLIDIAQQPADQLDQLFPDHVPISLARLFLSVWDRQSGELFDLIEQNDIDPEAQIALFEVLARLTFDGMISRKEAADFLARFERDALIDDGDMVWLGWEEAVVKLGLVELEGVLHRVWSKPVYEDHTQADHTETLERLKFAAANPSDTRLFDVDEIYAIDDPVDGVAWVERRAAKVAAWTAEYGDGDENETDDDVAKEIRLTTDEQNWLEGFLSCPQAPNGTMSLEMLDGFLTALVISPELVMPSEYLPWVWGEDDEGPDWDSQEQAEYVIGLLAKHWNAIAERRLKSAKHRPIIDTFGVAMPGDEWAEGFLRGIDMRAEAWEPLFDDRQADYTVLSILALCDGSPEEEQITEEMRGAILTQLPMTLQMIAAYWSGQAPPLPRSEPIRSAKVGRNAPCPCGSGKKYKKCCGSETPPTMH